MKTRDMPCAEETIRYEPARPVLKRRTGERIALNEAGFTRLCAGFLAEVESRYSWHGMARKSGKVTRKQARKSAARPRARASAARHVPTRGLQGWITHTDFASTDPAATKAWCAKVLGWKFRPALPMPGGEYHLFTYAAQGGGGIHRAGAAESPGSTPFVHVADTAAAFAKAIRAGAQEIMAPQRIMEGVTLAVVRVPGGITIGLSGP